MSKREGEESGVDLAYDAANVFDLDELNNMDLGTIKSKPIIGSPANELKFIPTKTRVGLKQQLDRQMIEEEKKRKQQNQHQQNIIVSSHAQQSSSAICMPSGPSTSSAEPVSAVKPQSRLLHPTRFHLEKVGQQELEKYHVNSKGRSAAAAHSLPPAVPTAAAAGSSDVGRSTLMGIHGVAATGLGSAPNLGGHREHAQSFDDTSSLDHSIADSELLLESIDFDINQVVDFGSNYFPYDQPQQYSHTPVKAESENGEEKEMKNASSPAYRQRSKMTEEQKNQKHKDVEKKRRSKEDDAIHKFREIVAPRSFDNEDITAKRLSRGDVLQMAVTRLEDVMRQLNNSTKTKRDLMTLTRQMLNTMQQMESLVNARGFRFPDGLSSQPFIDSMLDMHKDDKNDGPLLSAIAMHGSNLSPPPEKKRKSIAIVRASKRQPTAKATTRLSESARSQTSMDSGCQSSLMSADSMFTDPNVMEEHDESKSPLSGDPLLSTATVFNQEVAAPMERVDAYHQLDSSSVIASDNSSHNTIQSGPIPHTSQSNQNQSVVTSRQFRSTNGEGYYVDEKSNSIGLATGIVLTQYPDMAEEGFAGSVYPRETDQAIAALPRHQNLPISSQHDNRQTDQYYYDPTAYITELNYKL